MQPQQPVQLQPFQAPAPEQHDPSQYDFIVNPQQAPRQPLLGASKKQRLIFAGVGLLVLVMIATVVGKAISGSKPNPLVALTTVAKQQQEIIHLTSNLSTQTSLSVGTQNFVATTNLTISSSQQQILGYMGKNNLKVKVSVVQAYQDAAIDAQLQTATTASNYGPTFKAVMQQQLKVYKELLNKAYTKVSGPKGKALLKQEYDQAGLLEQQLNAN